MRKIILLFIIPLSQYLLSCSSSSKSQIQNSIVLSREQKLLDSFHDLSEHKILLVKKNSELQIINNSTGEQISALLPTPKTNNKTTTEISVYYGNCLESKIPNVVILTKDKKTDELTWSKDTLNWIYLKQIISFDKEGSPSSAARARARGR